MDDAAAVGGLDAFRCRRGTGLSVEDGVEMWDRRCCRWHLYKTSCFDDLPDVDGFGNGGLTIGE